MVKMRGMDDGCDVGKLQRQRHGERLSARGTMGGDTLRWVDDK